MNFHASQEPPAHPRTSRRWSAPLPIPSTYPASVLIFFLIVHRQNEKQVFLFFRPQTWMQWILATSFTSQVPRPQLVVTFPTTVVLGVTCLAAPLAEHMWPQVPCKHWLRLTALDASCLHEACPIATFFVGRMLPMAWPIQKQETRWP